MIFPPLECLLKTNKPFIRFTPDIHFSITLSMLQNIILQCNFIIVIFKDMKQSHSHLLDTFVINRFKKIRETY